MENEKFKGFEKITNVRLPFDRRDPNPRKNYGIHGLDIWFILKGEKGAVQYGVTLPVFLPHVQRELEGKHPDLRSLREIRGFDVGYHARAPQYEGQSSMEGCSIFDGEPCFYDGSSLRADEWTEEIFSTRGTHPEERLWDMLLDEYNERFGDHS